MTPRAERDRLALAELATARRLALRCAARCPRWVDRDELLGEAALALVEASRRFDPARGVPFGAYAARRVRGALLDSLRAQGSGRSRRRPESRSLDEARTVACPAPSPETRVVEAATCARIRSRLSERDRTVLRWRLGEDRTLAEIGARLGVTAPGAHLAVRRALRRARRAAESC